MPQPPRVRLDKLVVDRGLCDSRSRAQALIIAGKVVVGDHTESKPGALVPADAAVRLRVADHPFVSRGGLKLRGALDQFTALDVRDRVALDVGASTGGFTDCLLQAGAARVYAIDVGYGQLAWKLASDPRVVVLDRSNIRTLPREAIPEAADLAVADCSFISLVKVLPPVLPFLAARADVVALIKPQFELGPGRVGKGGIVRDAEDHAEACRAVLAAAEALGLRQMGLCDSPIEGQDGNREFLVWLRQGA
ncbi:TlyA family RNA methyltransferase [Nannocystis sp. ILAH1]|uniref:TlyA family RNA methyltransferase n=1 Tax=unclassified Nannocystis TaxID=2627009 RepID=UPI002271A05E|nr:TlyA family RNA methyltransferase [Nannocystis sp. ILAH1]MCY1072634.1 TlyA family RNA methyltransferase [Nannocystis sp. RBIL2]